jgi:3-methyladenine DNA glycosylase AlkC
MAEPLKNIYNDTFFSELKTSVKKAIPGFDTKKFIAAVKNKQWNSMELKQRMRHLSSTLYEYLKGDYPAKLSQLLKIVDALPAQSKVQYSGLAYMYIPDLLEQYGLNEIELSLKAMEQINMITSCEFAIRPYLLANEKKVMKQMLAWSKHKHQNIRRFASEGCRPRLPWAMAIPAFKKDPSTILPILENLKDDTSLYVQKSVANNLNDISKDHPELVIKIAKQWQGTSAAADWIIKHACRGLLKSGHKDALHLFGTAADVKCSISDIKLSKQKIKIGEQFQFAFDLQLKEKKNTKLRIEYAVYYKKSNGSLSKKVFKINEASYDHNTFYSFARKHSFKDLTTRKHHAGGHAIAIIVNGNEYARQDFILTI